jgi:hypothetical protein
MFGFCAKTNALKSAMFDLLETENPYAFRVMFRCLCEQYLKFMYVFTRFMREKTDDVGVEYRSFCGAIEMHDYAGAVELAESLVGYSVVAEVDRIVARVYPQAATLTKTELERASAKFRYRAILKFLTQERPSLVSEKTPFLAAIVPAYALLSSYVHGGPWTDIDLFGSEWSEAIEQCRRDSELAFLMTASVLFFTALVVSREFPEHGIVASRTKEVMDDVIAGGQD